MRIFAPGTSAKVLALLTCWFVTAAPVTRGGQLWGEQDNNPDFVTCQPMRITNADLTQNADGSCDITTGGSMTTVKESTVQVGGNDIVTTDYGPGFDVVETPDTEVNITLDFTEVAGHDNFTDFATNEHFDTSTLTTGSIPFSNGTTFLEDNVGLFYDNTNNRVGLGTTSPSKEIHILGTVPTIRLSDSDAGTDQAVATLISFFRGASTNRVGFWGMASSSNDKMALATDYAAGQISFATGSNVEALLIDSSGNSNFKGDIFTANATGVVIGHTAQINFGAISEFQVLGTGTADSSMGFARFQANASGPDVRFLKSRGTTIGANTLVQDGDFLGRFRFQAADGGDFNTTGAQVHAEIDGDPGANDMPTRLVFSTTLDGASSVTERMTILNDGNVGIGDDTPDSPLEVLSTTDPQVRITHTDGIDDLTIGVDANGDVKFTPSGEDFVVVGNFEVQDAGPHISLNPTSGDTFGFHVDPSNSVAFINNETDGVHYLTFQGDHDIIIGGVLVPQIILLTTGTGDDSVVLPVDSIGIQELDATNEPTDTQAYTFDSATGRGKWTAGGSSNSFETIAVSGQSNVVADSSTDTLTLVNGSNITITTNASTDTITIAAAGGSDTNAPKLYYWPAAATLPLQPVADLATGAEDGVAPITKDTDTNLEILGVAFNDTLDEFRAVTFKIPSDVATGVAVSIGFAGYAATAALQDVALIFAHYCVADGENWDGNVTEEALTATLTNTQDAKDFIIKSDETSATSLGWVANDTCFGFLGRDGDHATDDGLSGDFILTDFWIEIPRA